MASVAEGNVGVAFALVIGSGLASSLGGAVVFFPSLVKLASRRVLASGLGFSAGVMIYVSFVEFMLKSNQAFSNIGLSDFAATFYSSLCFFGGVLAMIVSSTCLCLSKYLFSESQALYSFQLINFFLRCFSKGHHHHHHQAEDKEEDLVVGEEGDSDEVEDNRMKIVGAEADAASQASGESLRYCIGCLENPGAELEEWQRKADEEEGKRALDQRNLACNISIDDPSMEVKTLPCSEGSPSNPEETLDLPNEIKPSKPKSIFKSKPKFVDEEKGELMEVINKDVEDDVSDVSENQPMQEAAEDPHVDKKLIKMGIHTALAIAIHNFPEGLSTFVAALGDSRSGAVLALAIAIHNIPEGLCVAMPIYYATGNRWKAFGWAVFSGLTEPLAALLGWLVLANIFSEVSYAIMFGFTGGMMVMISVREILPTAHRYDDHDTVVTYSFIVGMFVMASSIVLLNLSR